MNDKSVAPCGVICDLCLGFQRDKNKCSGCMHNGSKPYHCTVCSIKSCPEKEGKEDLLCVECQKFPCRRIRDLDKRYISKYGESPVQNLRSIADVGLEAFIEDQSEKWKCPGCGRLYCVHRSVCLVCGAKNVFYPDAKG